MTKSKVVAGWGLLTMGLLGMLIGAYVSIPAVMKSQDNAVLLALIPIGFVIGAAIGAIIDHEFFGVEQ